MSKRYTKIICTALAAVSAVTLAVMPACSSNWRGVSGDKDNSTVVSSNGGFLVETGEGNDGYVYFINGKASNTDYNKFGSVVKGSVQRIKKQDIADENYANTQTVVPSVYYSGNYNAGIYIYDGYIYYATPSTAKNTEGEVLNSNLDFKRTKLDGTDTTDGYIWQSSDNAVDYRYVQPEKGGDVYLIYALSENLYGTSTTNIHSVNCRTKKNTVLAYNVTDYAFDTADPETPYVYYTLNVPYYLGESGEYAYNQLYRVRADVTESPREYDLSGFDGYDASSNPLYINLGDYVFDGIGWFNYSKPERLSQFNYAFGKDKTYTFNHSDYTFDIRSYKDGVLYYTRKSEGNSASLFTLTAEQIDADNDGRVDESWDAMAQTFADGQTPLIAGADTTEYEFVEMGGKLWAINAGTSGITKTEVLVEQQKLDTDNTLTMTDAGSATILDIRVEGEGANAHTNVYYSVTGGNGYTVNRIAIDGSFDDYKKLSAAEEPDLTYRSVRVLDIDASNSWFKPEFVGNKLFFASTTAGMTDYNYIMVCDLTGENGIMTNNEIKKLNDKYEAVTEEIEAFDKEENADGSAAYDGLSNALKYLFHTGDVNYIDELRKALVDVEGRDIEYAYSNDSVQIYKDFATADGVWSDDEGTNYKTDTKTINGKTVYANSRDYYYTVVGKISESDQKAINTYFKNQYMKTYPVDDSTWWSELSHAAKVGFVFGMVACGLIVTGGIICLAVWLVSLKKGASEERERSIKVDITDDKSLDVYGDGEGNGEGGETPEN